MSRSSEFLQTLTFPEGIAPAEGLEDAHEMLQNEFALMVSDRLQQQYEIGVDPTIIIPLAGGLHPLGYVLREMNQRVSVETVSEDVFDRIVGNVVFADIQKVSTPNGANPKASVMLNRDVHDGEPICVVDDIADSLWMYKILRKQFCDSPMEMFVPVTRKTTAARIAFEILPISWCRTVGSEWIKGSCGMNDGKIVQEQYPHWDAQEYKKESELSSLQRFSVVGTARDGSGKFASIEEQLDFYRKIALQSILRDKSILEAHRILEFFRQQAKLTGQINHEVAFEMAEHIVEYDLQHPELYD